MGMYHSMPKGVIAMIGGSKVRKTVKLKFKSRDDMRAFAKAVQEFGSEVSLLVVKDKETANPRIYEELGALFTIDKGLDFYISAYNDYIIKNVIEKTRFWIVKSSLSGD